MKKTSFMTGFVLACLQSFSQLVPVNEPDYNKPKLFQGLPSQIRISMASVNNLFDQVAGQYIDINLSDSSLFRFEGEITAVATKYDGRIRTVVIRSVNYPGASFTISKITASSGLISYQGRIVSFEHGDLFQLQFINGSYVLVKKNFYDLVNE